MDISTLSLPLRRDRGSNTMFNVTPSLTSVNVSYETATRESFDHDYIEQPNCISKDGVDGENKASDFSDTRSHGRSLSSERSPSTSSMFLSSNSTNEFDESAEHAASSVDIAGKHFTAKESEAQLHDIKVRRHRRSLSSISLASSECQNFVASLKEPKYAKPLSADEIGWIFQDFYVKLKQDILGSDNELLTSDEQEERDLIKTEIDSILDRCEKAVTSGELHSKLFNLGGSYDRELQDRVNAVRECPNIMNQLMEKLELSSAVVQGINFDSTIGYLSRVSRELSPKAKLSALIKALHEVVEALPKNSNDADSIFPLFVLGLAKSSMSEWWKNYMYIQRFRRSSELTGEASYALTSFEAAIRFVEEFTLTDDVPEGVDPALFQKPLRNPRVITRDRSSSQSSKNSISLSTLSTYSLSKRIEETFNSCKSILATTRKSSNSLIDPRFLNADAESLTLADVRVLLRKYKKLAEFVDAQK